MRAGDALTTAAAAARGALYEDARRLGGGRDLPPTGDGTDLAVEIADGSEITAIGGEHLFVWLCDDGSGHLVNLGPAYG